MGIKGEYSIAVQVIPFDRSSFVFENQKSFYKIVKTREAHFCQLSINSGATEDAFKVARCKDIEKSK